MKPKFWKWFLDSKGRIATLITTSLFFFGTLGYLTWAAIHREQVYTEVVILLIIVWVTPFVAFAIHIYLFWHALLQDPKTLDKFV